MTAFEVFVDDNYHFMDEEARCRELCRSEDAAAAALDAMARAAQDPAWTLKVRA